MSNCSIDECCRTGISSASTLAPCCHRPAKGGNGACMLPGRKPNGATLPDAMKSYLDACRIAGNVSSWLSMQEDIITAFIAFHEDSLRVLEQAAPHHLTSYLALCQRRGNNSATLRRKATVVRAWGRWCRKSGLVEVCKLADADLPHEHPTPIEVASLAVYLEKIREKQPRYAEEFRVYLGSGLRRCELLQLRWGDIDLVAGTVNVRRRKEWSPKARKDRIVALTEDAKAALASICRQRRKKESQGPYLNDRGFLTIYPTTLTHAWLAFTRDTGLPPRLHSTRHAHATAAVERGAILTDVQAQLGHARINTTMRYVKPNPAGPLRLVKLLDAKKSAAPKSRGRSANQRGINEASV